MSKKRISDVKAYKHKVSRMKRTFTGLYPRAIAVLIDSITLSCPLRRVMNSNFDGTNVSKLIFKAESPHSFSFESFFERVIPFVVMANVFSPFKLDSCRQISSISFLMVGSPPVKRILSTPELTNRFASRTISFWESSRGPGVSSTPSAGIQY